MNRSYILNTATQKCSFKTNEDRNFTKIPRLFGCFSQQFTGGPQEPPRRAIELPSLHAQFTSYGSQNRNVDFVGASPLARC